MEWAASCVYTIRHPDELQKCARLAKSGSTCTLSEQKRWVAAHKLWEQCEPGQRMAVIFGDATHTSHLIFFAELKKVAVKDGHTDYTIENLKKFRGEHRKMELVLRSSGKKISPNFIRPYAICKTPDFLRDRH